jgi:hypothetical protein
MTVTRMAIKTEVDPLLKLRKPYLLTSWPVAMIITMTTLKMKMIITMTMTRVLLTDVNKEKNIAKIEK